MLAILRRSVVGVLKAREPEVGQGDLHGPVGRAVAEHVRGLHIAVDGGVPPVEEGQGFANRSREAPRDRLGQPPGRDPGLQVPAGGTRRVVANF